MPLIQWIMQNLQLPQGGAVGGGTALVQQTSFLIPSGGVQAGGDSFYNKISRIIARGGAKGGGEAGFESSSVNRKRVKHLSGDVVYDNCNKSWVVISFQFASSGEQRLNLTNNVTQKVLFESEISDQPIYVLGEGFCNSSIANLPVFSGRKLVSFGSNDIFDQSNLVESKIRSLSGPANNFPVYAGRRKVKL